MDGFVISPARSAAALAAVLGFSTLAAAQPAPVDSSSIAPNGSYVLHGRVLADDSLARGTARIAQAADGTITLTRAVPGRTIPVALGAAESADRWVFASNLPAGAAGDQVWATITASSLNLRAGPAGTHPIRARGPRGAKLLVVGQSGVWRELINRDGRKVWAHGGYMTFETRSAPSRAETVVVRDPRGPWGITFRGATPIATERWEARSNDLVFFGMGQYAFHEVWDLRSVQGVKVHAILPQDEQDKVELLGGLRDMNQDADVEALLDAMALTGEQRDKAKEALTETRTRAKDEAAQLLVVFWEAERGERTIERLLLSGHSVGTGVWGDHNGHFKWEILEKFCALFPNAARQVEDVMVAGCYSNSLRKVDRFRGMFPAMKSFWAYGKSAPGSYTGATIHNAAWERVTRGHEPALVTRTLVRGTRKGENVATWNIVTGFEADVPLRALSAVQADLTALQQTFDEYDAGDQVVQDTQRGPLRDYYSLVQELLGNPDLPEADRPAWELARDRTIRLIFYVAPVTQRFVDAYGADVTAAYTALGLAPVDYTQLSRKEGREAIEAYRAARDAHPGPQDPLIERVLDLLERGLRDLDPDVIPSEWV